MNSNLKKRIQKTQEEARARLAKRGVMRFRCTENDILRLNEFAAQNGVPVGAMMRKWVLERLEQEEDGMKTGALLRTDISQKMNNFERRLKIVEKLVRQAL